jgi:hypothetical protein
VANFRIARDPKTIHKQSAGKLRFRADKLQDRYIIMGRNGLFVFHCVANFDNP